MRSGRAIKRDKVVRDAIIVEREEAGYGVTMNRSALISIFLRTLTIQVSFNFRTMQSLGFAYAMLPLMAKINMDVSHAGFFITRHMRMFNTHPYLAASVVGSAVRMEEEDESPKEAVEDLKTTLMGPYAAIGDSFFWGALKQFSAEGAVMLALAGTILAPAAFLLLFTPIHIWVRVKGFAEGYRCGRNGIEFIKSMNLPAGSRALRYASLLMVSILAIMAAESAGRIWGGALDVPDAAAAIVLLFLVIGGIRLKIPQVVILYGTSLLCVAISIKIW